MNIGFNEHRNQSENIEKMKSEKELLELTSNMYSKKTDLAWNNMLAEINQEAEGKVHGNFIFNPWFLKVAAGFLVLLGLTWGIWQILRPQRDTVRTLLSQREILLPDGSSVYLNGNSQISYPNSFASDSRKVFLRGEAFFKVKKNRNKAFIVETENAQIKVFGTSFNVFAPKGRNRVEVMVKTGVVGLASRGDLNDQLILHEGDFGLLDAGKTSIKSSPGENYLSWRTKVFRFKQESLQQVVSDINRAYVKHIELATDSLKTLQLTSTYYKVGFNTILESICLTFHLQQNQLEGKIILSKQK